VSAVFRCGLEVRAIEVRLQAEARVFFSNLCLQTRSGALPASFIVGTCGTFTGGKAPPGRDADDSPHLVQKSRMIRSYICAFPQAPSLVVVGQI
jgi:hypothetical protein